MLDNLIESSMHAGSYFVLSMFDKLWHQELSEEDALNLHLKGIEEVKNRLVVAPPDFIIKVASATAIDTFYTSCMCF